MSNLSKDELSELGRKLASARKQMHGHCENCGKEISGPSHTRFCSTRCRVAAHRAQPSKKLPNEEPSNSTTSIDTMSDDSDVFSQRAPIVKDVPPGKVSSSSPPRDRCLT
jgi:endogenous inhibitor of DNA gyrase (YacG/DUF329 family)